MSISEPIKKILRPVVDRGIHLGGQSYIAGETLDQAIDTFEYLSARGCACTLGYWNQTGESSAAIADVNIAALQAIKNSNGNGYLSVKLPPMHFDENLYAKIVNKARELRVPIHLDSHSLADADRTLELITRHTQPPYDDIGYSLPGRWKRSVADADLAAELGITVRVVKGQWDDPEDPERDPRAGFLAIVECLAGRAKLVRLASHDPTLIRESIKLLKCTDTACELELLYGLPVKAVLAVAKEYRVPVRMYIPYGMGSLPYALKYLRKNPRVLWWLFKDALLGSYKKRFPKLNQ
ncbi:MAG: Unknown protein [uncultured Thiotrichaceae bacterium]|uniref:Proline dehydrogenase n=1 Tax=uncultured Thiotrichaceae bacterium TaxID=298394 RepID=A0A6S6SIH7_9GAMM|nr:MAG: Unknown protein [uncultured Thiotrichaceae bacterium]